MSHYPTFRQVADMRVAFDPGPFMTNAGGFAYFHDRASSAERRDGIGVLEVAGSFQSYHGRGSEARREASALRSRAYARSES